MAVLSTFSCAILAISISIASNPLPVSSEQTQTGLKQNAAGESTASLSPPALTYIPPVGLGLWHSEGSDACQTLQLLHCLLTSHHVGDARSGVRP